MITINNFKKVLRKLNYTEKEEMFSKECNNDVESIMIVDFKNQELKYPKKLKPHRDGIKNFSYDENFVVFECITRLLDKGYKSEHIELEKPMPGGHHDTGGYCDILVKDNNGRTFLLIECKKADEFNNFWKKMLINGGQLFNYYNSYRQAQALCLYTSDYIDDELNYTSYIVSMIDNDEYLQSDKTLKSFKRVQEENGGKEEYFQVWKTTYQQDYNIKGIFEDDIASYTVGKLKFTVNDLIEVDNVTIQKKYHEFATILRQHNVGSHENAFDKLVNLFLAKIVDESVNSDELQFHWRGAAHDDYFSLQDRLQKLYKNGMEKFLGEQITYIDQKEISNAFHLFQNDPDATRNKILEYFRQLKFYTNNDFAFLDVHNEVLFYQNAIILKKIVQMLEDIKLKTEEQNQFLGDLFEGFLDQGVKQSEGQYFTPMPIVKFLVSSLPLEEIIKNTNDIPKTIDYACGAGHFLTEYAACIKKFVEKYRNVSVTEYYKETYGIEKEYRLSKVAKVSTFMYGQDDIQVICGDALAKNIKIEDGKFSILIANPPYSVKGFLETLTEKERNAFELIKQVSDMSKNNSIETFFVERAKQLLKEDGVAAIVLPSSVLSNGNIYISCREIILKYFDIVAIAEFGSGTFSKTGTNTVTMFLRRRKSNPELAEHYQYRVDTWFKSDYSKDIVFMDNPLIDKYCKHCGIDVAEYKNWLNGGSVPTAIIFDEYEKKIKTSVLYKNIQKKKLTKKYMQNDKNKELSDYIIKSMKLAEKEKLYYFMLAVSNSCPIVVVKSPLDHKGIKTFLGYEWSGAKGSEGIKYIENMVKNDGDIISINKGINSINTPMFDPCDYANVGKINSIIRRNFEMGVVDVPEPLKDYVFVYQLVDMLDFSRVEFDKSIRINGINIKSFDIKSKYKIKKIGDISEISRGASPRPIAQYLTEDDNGVNWIKIGDVSVEEKYITHTEQKITAEGALKSKRVYSGDLIISNSMSVGRPYILKIDGCIHDGWLLISNISKEIDRDYFYYILSSEFVQKQFLDNALGGVVKNLNTSRIASVQIPIPELSIQKKIVSECENIDREYNVAIENNKSYKEQISQLFNKLYNLADRTYKLSDKDVFDIFIGKRVLNKQVNDNFTIPVYSANVYEPFGFINKPLINDFSVSSVVWGIDGDWQVNCFPANYVFYPTDHCGILRIKTDQILPKYAAFALKKEGQILGFRRNYRASIDRIERISIKVPSIEQQQRIIPEIEKLEEKIEENKILMDKSINKREEIVKNILFL